LRKPSNPPFRSREINPFCKNQLTESSENNQLKPIQEVKKEAPNPKIGLELKVALHCGFTWVKAMK
jgi:hypothetical protein